MSTQPSQSAPRHSAADTAASEQSSIGKLVHDATVDISTLVRGEIELAKLELRTSVKGAGLGAAFFAAALVFVLLALPIGLIALAEGLVAIGLWRWLSYLIVFAVLIVLAVVIALIGLRFVKRVRAPQKTIDTTKETVAYLRKPTAS